MTSSARRGFSGVPTPFGELLIGIEPFGSGLASDLQPILAGTALHAFPIPDDPGLVGASVSAQSALTGGGVTLCNALDLVLGNR